MDRLPDPVADKGAAGLVERASATSARRYHAAIHTAAATSTAPVPKRLSDVERWMVGAILVPEDSAAVPDVFTAGPRQTARERFEIYRSGYRARLVECLEDDYPVLSAALGRELFEALASAYVDSYPSTSPSLNFFGRHMPAFAARWSPFGSGEAALFFSELAALEWTLVEAIHAEAAEPFTPGRLEALGPGDWANLRFSPSDAAKLLRFEFPVNAYYQAHRTGKDPEIPNRSPSATAVYRRGVTVWRMDLTPAMARVLQALISGVPLGEALSRIGVDETDEAALKEAERSVMIWFREWVSGGIFSDFSVDS